MLLLLLEDAHTHNRKDDKEDGEEDAHTGEEDRRTLTLGRRKGGHPHQGGERTTARGRRERIKIFVWQLGPAQTWQWFLTFGLDPHNLLQRFHRRSGITVWIGVSAAHTPKCQLQTKL